MSQGKGFGGPCLDYIVPLNCAGFTPKLGALGQGELAARTECVCVCGCVIWIRAHTGIIKTLPFVSSGINLGQQQQQQQAFQLGQPATAAGVVGGGLKFQLGGGQTPSTFGGLKMAAPVAAAPGGGLQLGQQAAAPGGGLQLGQQAAGGGLKLGTAATGLGQQSMGGGFQLGTAATGLNLGQLNTGGLQLGGASGQGLFSMMFSACIL